MSYQPVLELVICTYNNAVMLEHALKAIAHQRVSNAIDWGVLVVNNNCTDETIAVVEKVIQSGKISHLRLVTEPTQGLTPARLCGVNQTTAPWIAFVDDDCLLHPDWVTAAIRFAAQHPKCGAFGGRVTLEWENLPADYVLQLKYSFAEQEHGLEPKRVSCLVGAGIVLNREALTAVGWLDHQFLADRIGKKLVSGGDVEIALRLSALYELWYVPTCQLFHQIPSSRTSYTYLRRINYQLGASKLFGDSMLWQQSYATWALFCLREAWQHTIYNTKVLLKTAVRSQSTAHSIITLYFWWGYWVGLWQFMRMSSQKRGQILGCGKPTTVTLAVTCQKEGLMS